MTEARQWQAPLETKGVAEMLRLAVEEKLTLLLDNPLREEIPAILRLLALSERVPVALDLWKAQTLFAQLCHRHLRFFLERCQHEQVVMHQLTFVRHLGEQLGFSSAEGIALEKWGEG
jgi:hypothetical protein